MKIKALITTLVLGSSTAAFAQPVSGDASWSFHGRVDVGGSTNGTTRDHRYPMPAPAPVYDPAPAPVYNPAPQPMPVRSYYRPRFAPTWMTLGTVRIITKDPQTFFVGRQQGRISTLLFQSQGFKSKIEDVTILYANGAQETIHVGQYINAANKSVRVALGDRGLAIDSIVVTGGNARRSSYTVYAI